MTQTKRDGCAQRGRHWNEKRRAEYERLVAAQLGDVVRELLIRDHGSDELARVAGVLERGDRAELARELAVWTIRIARYRARAEQELRRPEVAFELAGQMELELARCRRIADRYEADQREQDAQGADGAVGDVVSGLEASVVANKGVRDAG